MNERLEMIPHGIRGIDANTPLEDSVAKRFKAAGFDFALRYLPRESPPAPHDLSGPELNRLLAAGIAVMPVQHVEAGEWVPSEAKGRRYGATAGDVACKLGILRGTCVWLDLELVSKETDRETVIAYANGWHREVTNRGYSPGLYVGFQPGLNAVDLYYRLRFSHYWAAYNLNRDQVPVIRGCQMWQKAVTPGSKVAGIPFEYDVNTVKTDQRNGRPMAHAPLEWI